VLTWDAVANKSVLVQGAEVWEYDGATFTWQRRAEAFVPGVRSGARATWDSARQHIFLFGGTSMGMTMQDTWRRAR
jgi:hypothetical protein